MEDKLRQWDRKERQDTSSYIYMNPAGNGILSEEGYMSDKVEESDGERREEYLHNAWIQTQWKENVWRGDHFSAGEARQSEFESLPTKHHVQTPDRVEYLPNNLQNKSARVDSNAKPLKKRDTSHFFKEPTSDTSGVKHLSPPGRSQYSQQERDRERSSWTSVIRDSPQTSNGTDRTLNFKPLDQESFWLKDHGLDHTGLEEVCVTPLLGERHQAFKMENTHEPNLCDGGGSLNQEEPARSCIQKLDSFIGGSGFHECSSSDSVSFRKTSVITQGPKLESNTASHSPSDSACSPASHSLRQQEVHAFTSDPGLNKAEDECENAKLYILTENQEAESSLSQLEETHVQCSTKEIRNSRLMLKIASEQKKSPTTQIKSEDGDPCDGQVTNVVEITAGPEKTTPRCDEDAEKRNASERKQNRSTHLHLNTEHATFERSPEKGQHFQVSETLGKPDTNRLLANSEDVECPHTQHSNNSTPSSDQLQHDFREVRRSTSKAEDQAAENMNSQQTEKPLLDSRQDPGSIVGTEVANLTREDCESETSTGILNEPKRDSTEGVTVENVSEYEADVLNRLSKLETDQKSPRKRKRPANQNSGTNPVSHTLPSHDSPKNPETKSVGDFCRNQKKTKVPNLLSPKSTEHFVEVSSSSSSWTTGPELKGILLITTTNSLNQEGIISKNNDVLQEHSEDTTLPPGQSSELAFTENATKQTAVDINIKPPKRGRPPSKKRKMLIEDTSLPFAQNAEPVLSENWVELITEVDTNAAIPRLGRSPLKKLKLHPEDPEDTSKAELTTEENNTNVPKRGRPSSSKKKILIEDTSLPFAENVEPVLSEKGVELITEVDPNVAFPRLGRSPLKKRKLHPEDLEDTSLPQGDHPEHSLSESNAGPTTDETNPDVPRRGRAPAKNNKNGFLRGLSEDSTIPLVQNTELILSENHTELTPGQTIPRQGRALSTNTKTNVPLDIDIGDKTLPRLDSDKPCPESKAERTTSPKVRKRGRPKKKLHQEQTGHSTVSSIKNFGLSQSNEELTKRVRDHSEQNKFLGKPMEDSTLPVVQHTEPLLPENNSEITKVDQKIKAPRRGRPKKTKLLLSRKDTVLQASQNSETSRHENNTGTAKPKNVEVFTNPEEASVIPGPVRKQKRPKKKVALKNDEMVTRDDITEKKPGQKRPKVGGSRTDVELDQKAKCQSGPNGTTFRHIAALHRRGRTDEKPYKCKICGETFAQLCELTSHQNAHKPHASFPCPCCRRSFAQKADLLWHFKSHLNELGTAEDGEQDNTRKTSRSSPDKHIQEETSTIHKQLQEHPMELTAGGPCCFHGGEEAVQPPAPLRECLGISSSFGEHWCSRCGQSFESRQTLRAHTRTHALAWRSAGSRGGQSFSSWNRRWWNLLSHRMKSRRYSCDQCSLLFHFFTSYEEHMREHAGPKPYRAGPLRPETFTQDQPLKCDVCSKSFGSLRNLSKHSVLHHGSTSHVCLLCNRSFAGTRVLREHLDTHQTASPKTFSFPHKCSKCSGCFSSVDVLYAHQMVHSRELPAKASTPKPSDPDSTRHWLAELKLHSVPDDKRLYQYSHPDRLYVTTVTQTQDHPEAGDQEAIADTLHLPQKNTSVGPAGRRKQRRTAFVERSVEIGGGESSEEDVDDLQCANCAEKLTSVSSLYEHYIVHAMGTQMYRYSV